MQGSSSPRLTAKPKNPASSPLAFTLQDAAPPRVRQMTAQDWARALDAFGGELELGLEPPSSPIHCSNGSGAASALVPYHGVESADADELFADASASCHPFPVPGCRSELRSKASFQARVQTDGREPQSRCVGEAGQPYDDLTVCRTTQEGATGSHTPGCERDSHDEQEENVPGPDNAAAHTFREDGTGEDDSPDDAEGSAVSSYPRTYVVHVVRGTPSMPVPLLAETAVVSRPHIARARFDALAARSWARCPVAGCRAACAEGEVAQHLETHLRPNERVWRVCGICWVAYFSARGLSRHFRAVHEA
ncbi:hypothetical protein AURDEDRAFT_114316 [Auricularia subglabra TFB-10046 SS5]|uniref:C2H2-type domain-containing protein n=1 Tax=Auricularia subglabra (strain TFB-10046 / SS5) TaxID=717982 RepID=J0WZB0_AURST|nr:hypothetical protein AURDEDRAFT_114316 [Auricularia subglabra TFB-10046 SS5]